MQEMSALLKQSNVLALAASQSTLASADASADASQYERLVDEAPAPNAPCATAPPMVVDAAQQNHSSPLHVALALLEDMISSVLEKKSNALDSEASVQE